MIKKLFSKISLLFILFYLIINNLDAQEVVINGVKLVFKDGVNFVLKGDYSNNGVSSIISSGTNNIFKLDGSMDNSGTQALNFSGVKILLIGSTDVAISGSQPIKFEKVEIAKNSSSNVVSLNRNIEVSDELLMTQGQIDLLNNNIDLGTTGYLSNETNTNRIKATDGASDGHGTGTITATRTFSSGLNSNVAGMGIDINSTSYTGTKTIKRGHKILMGSGSYTMNESVMRYFDLPGFGRVTSGNEIVFHYFENELNSHLEDGLIAYQDVKNNLDNINYWAPFNTTPNIATDNCGIFDFGTYGYYQYYTPSGTYDFSSGRFTLGSILIPLPIELTAFNIVCADNGYTLQWSTTSETNNHYFTIERSTDGVNFIAITQIDGAGNSNQLREYSYFDLFSNNGLVYYRLLQTDFDNASHTYPLKAIDCSKSNEFETKTKIYTPNHRDIVVDYYSNQEQNMTIAIYDDLGKLIHNSNEQVMQGDNHIEITNLRIHSAIYVVKIIAGNVQKVGKVQLWNTLDIE
ncbi:MAG: T9SS type A sorting domain-containing protein [Bacteroidota bacterium]